MNRMETDTEHGLRIVGWSFLLHMISISIYLIAFAIVLATYPAAQQALPFFSVIALLALPAAILVIVDFVAVVLFFIGLMDINEGRFEFGTGRERDVQRSIRFLVGAIIVYVVGYVVGFVSALMLAISAGSMPPDLFLLVAGTGILGGMFTLGAFLTSMMLYYLVRVLISPREKRILNIGLALIVLAPLAGALLLATLAVGEPDLISLTIPLLFFGIRGTLGGPLQQGLSLVALGLVYRAYIRTCLRMRKGEIVPSPPPSPVPPYHPPTAR